MYNEITIGDKKVPMMANGATPFWFNQIFKEDFFEASKDFTDDAKAVNIFTKIAYVMALQASDDKKQIKKGSEAGFLDWLADFGTMDIQNALPDVVDLYTGQTEGTAVPKK